MSQDDYNPNSLDAVLSGISSKLDMLIAQQRKMEEEVTTRLSKLEHETNAKISKLENFRWWLAGVGASLILLLDVVKDWLKGK